MKLENLREWEVVEIIVRRHWIIFVMLGLFLLWWIITSLLVYAFFGSSFWVHMLQICFWLIFSLVMYIEWLNNELDLFVITNNRIIWIEQISFLNRTVSEAILQQVQEVNSQTKWFFANILNYGTLYIQTAWNKTTLAMNFVPDIIIQARKINNIADVYKDKYYNKLQNNTQET